LLKAERVLRTGAARSGYQRGICDDVVTPPGRLRRRQLGKEGRMNQMKPVNANRLGKKPARPALLMVARKWHSYSGAFFAPAILFFAATGALQTFNLHKPQPGYQPPALIQALASMHKNQNLKVKYLDAPKAVGPDGPRLGRRGKARDVQAADAPAPVQSSLSFAAQTALKIFAVLISIGLAATTLLGLWMSWNTTRRTAVLLWFAAGAILPMALMLLV
jgi:hypothetical protein